MINNDGWEYASDKIINLQNHLQFDTEKFDFGCGAEDPIKLDDSVFIYSDGCDDNSHIEIFYLNKMVHKTIKNKELNGFTLIDAISTQTFVVMNNESRKIFNFNTITNKFTPSDYTIKEYIGYWRWAERLDKDLSELYKKIE